MKQPKTFHVKGQLYTVQPFDVDYGMDLLEELLILAGEPLIRLILKVKDSLKDGKLDAKQMIEMDISPDEVMPLFTALRGQLGGGRLNGLCKKVLTGTLVGNSPASCADDYSTRFMGEYATLMMVVGKSLGAQYGNFLDDLGGLAKAKAPKAP